MKRNYVTGLAIASLLIAGGMLGAGARESLEIRLAMIAGYFAGVLVALSVPYLLNSPESGGTDDE